MTCAHCGGTLTEKRGIEVGNIFKLGTKYSEAMNATYLESKGTTAAAFHGLLRHRDRPPACQHC